MRKVTIMSGVSGSGKSTEAKVRFRGAVAPMCEPVSIHQQFKLPIVVSADHYFLTDLGEYKFNPARLGLAHGSCLRHFIRACQHEAENVIVDNTNTTNEELAPYIAVALAYDYKVEVITVMCANILEVELACARSGHGVPFNSARGMHERLMNRKPPFHWQPQFGVTFLQVDANIVNPARAV